MKGKAIIQGIVIVMIFILTWIALSQVNWMNLLKITNTYNNLIT